MEKLTRIAMPLDMADTPDDPVDFFIRVTRLKIEDMEGEIIGRNKQLADMHIMLKSDPQNQTMTRTIEAIENICKTRIRAKKAFKSSLIKLQKFGHKMFTSAEQTDEEESTTP
jgi:hypothetical protein